MTHSTNKSAALKNLAGGAGLAGLLDLLSYGGDYSSESFSPARIGNAAFNTVLGAGGTAGLRHGLATGSSPATLGGASLIGLAPGKDLALKGIETLHGLDKNLAQERAMSPLRTAGMGALALGVPAALIMAARKMKPKDQADQGRITVTLPTRDPNDVETQVNLPISAFNLSQSAQGQLARDVRRRLRQERKERTKTRHPDTGNLVNTWTLGPGQKAASLIKRAGMMPGASMGPMAAMSAGKNNVAAAQNQQMASPYRLDVTSAAGQPGQASADDLANLQKQVEDMQKQVPDAGAAAPEGTPVSPALVARSRQLAQRGNAVKLSYVLDNAILKQADLLGDTWANNPITRGFGNILDATGVGQGPKIENSGMVDRAKMKQIQDSIASAEAAGNSELAAQLRADGSKQIQTAHNARSTEVAQKTQPSWIEKNIGIPTSYAGLESALQGNREGLNIDADDSDFMRHMKGTTNWVNSWNPFTQGTKKIDTATTDFGARRRAEAEVDALRDELGVSKLRENTQFLDYFRGGESKRNLQEFKEKADLARAGTKGYGSTFGKAMSGGMQIGAAALAPMTARATGIWGSGKGWLGGKGFTPLAQRGYGTLGSAAEATTLSPFIANPAWSFNVLGDSGNSAGTNSQHGFYQPSSGEAAPDYSSQYANSVGGSATSPGGWMNPNSPTMMQNYQTAGYSNPANYGTSVPQYNNPTYKAINGALPMLNTGSQMMGGPSVLPSYQAGGSRTNSNFSGLSSLMGGNKNLMSHG